MVNGVLRAHDRHIVRAAEHEASTGLNLPWQLPSHPVRQLLALKAIADLVAVTVLADYEPIAVGDRGAM